MKLTTLNVATMDDFDKWYDDQIEGEVGMTSAQDWQIQYLMEQIQFTDEQLDGIKLWLAQSPSYEEAEQFIYELYQRLPHPVTERGNYNQTQITKHIKEISGL